MNYKPGLEGSDNYTKWKTKLKITLQKYADLSKSRVKKNEPLGKYQPIFNILKTRIFRPEDQFSF